MFEQFRHYICQWNFIDALHFWIEIGQLLTLVILLTLAIKLWRKDRRDERNHNAFHRRAD